MSLSCKLTPVCTASLVLLIALSTTEAQNAALVSVDAVIQHSFKQTIPVIGRLVAKQSGPVAARINGPVQEILVQVGDRVTINQLLARIDTSQFELEKQQVEARKSEAHARLNTVRAQLALAGQEVERLEVLQLSSAVSRATYDDTLQQYNIAMTRVREVETAVASAQTNISMVNLKLSFSEVRAPYTGTVVSKNTEVGSYLQTGQAVVSLISDSQLEMESDIPYELLEGVPIGTMVSVVLDNGSEHSAQVRAAIPQEDSRTRTRRVRFEMIWQQQSGVLAAGQSVIAHLPAGLSRQILSVHKDGLIQRGSQTVVYIEINGTAELREIETGKASGNRLELLSGLDEGDLVIIRGNERLQPGQQVVTGNAQG